MGIRNYPMPNSAIAEMTAGCPDLRLNQDLVLGHQAQPEFRMKTKMLVLSSIAACAAVLGLGQTPPATPQPGVPPILPQNPAGPVPSLPPPVVPGDVTRRMNPFIAGNGAALGPFDRQVLAGIRHVCLRQGIALNRLPVGFIVQNGFVTMVGTVPSVEATATLEAIVAQVPGVVGIDDELQVAILPGAGNR